MTDTPRPAEGSSVFLVEFICFLILALITVFRKKLSSNDEYRHDVKSISDAIPAVTLNLIPQKAREGTTCIESNAKTSCLTSRQEMTQSSSICLSILSLDDNILLNIITYLPDRDIGHLALLSKLFLKNCTSDMIWEQLWKITYGTMWAHERFVEIRRIRGITWNPTMGCDFSGQLDTSNPLQSKISNFRPPQGWLHFYLEFGFCWMDWLLAGCCTQEYCLIGLYGSLYNITNFLPDHPGSSESLTEASGGDGSDVFSDIGHSTFATSLADMFLLWGEGSKGSNGEIKGGRSPQIPKQFSQQRRTRFEVEMKRDRFFAERLILRDNYVVNSNVSSTDNFSLVKDERSSLEEESDISNSNQESELLQAGAAWPESVNLNFKVLESLSSSSSSLQKSVKSIAENVFLAKAKAGNFLKRSLVGSRRRDRVAMKCMAPSFFKTRGKCLPGCKHTGRLRMLYDPLELQWWGWWTCCGQGELAIDRREEDMLCAEAAKQHLNFKMC